jgi:multiple sugar transport system ATP-binding protein
MRAEFKRLHRELGMTMLYAPPDQLEALTMGQRVGVIQDGKVVAVGPPRDLYEAPDNLYIAQMVGSPPINFLETKGSADGQDDLPFLLTQVAAAAVKSGQPVTLGLRPHDIALAGTGAEAMRFTAKIHLTEPLGDVTVIDVKARETTMKMVLREEVAAQYKVGQEIEIAFDPADLHVFDQTTGERLRT